ncbi:DUF397 domain-containing protein [Streptomyces xiaopingdaonensis]|uniref:DUF397 domain-containing protein n=1 Tax=Streptomyces xiaopingdaonensis TaxID=1565415 RepID=UPI0002FE0BF3|nr:DUF397 domain-containing protein [Streptomyces xiaopingdaonensis]
MTTESPRWFTSSYSDNGGDCVEVATNLAALRGVVPVRDTKDRSLSLAVAPSAFASFVGAVRRGRFDG